MDTSDLAFFTDALAPLCSPLHEVLPQGWERAASHCGDYGMTDRVFSSTRSHLARGHIAKELRDRAFEEGLGGWKVRLGKNCSVVLYRRYLTLRLLRPLDGMIVPPPGPNARRQAIYRQDLPETNLLGPEASSLLGIWNYDPLRLAADVGIVRPCGFWSAGGAEVVDLDFMLPTAGSDLVDLEFVPSDEDLDPLPFEDADSGEVDEEDNGGAGTSG